MLILAWVILVILYITIPSIFIAMVRPIWNTDPWWYPAYIWIMINLVVGSLIGVVLAALWAFITVFGAK